MRTMPFVETLGTLERTYDAIVRRPGAARALTAGVESGAEKIAVVSRALSDLTRVGMVKGLTGGVRTLPGGRGRV